ncbi:MAG: zf-HC2 domain-containing protein [Acidobacteriota bacterium]|nr:zf-HC2 domain-containing protein [Acidobacteriota bacterium]
MVDFNQFGSIKPTQGADPQHCAQCEAMLPDALDGTLSAADQATFDLHLVGCPGCASMLADAQRGAAWMEMLHSPRPEPPAHLLERILAQTSGQLAAQIANKTANKTAGVHGKSSNPLKAGTSAGKAFPATASAAQPSTHTPNTLLGRPMLVPGAATPEPALSSDPALSANSALSSSPALGSGNLLPFRTRLTSGLRSFGQTMLQPRLAMTAAMAFFSIALTLNLTGVHLNQLRASDLKPSSLLRSCYETKARVARYSNNLRVVYELESRVRDLQHSSDDDGQAGQAGQTGQTGQAPSTPSSQRNPAGKPTQKPAGDPQPPDGPNPDKKQSHPRPNPGSSRRELPAGSILQVNATVRRSSLPAVTEAFVVFTPSRYKQEGGLV